MRNFDCWTCGHYTYRLRTPPCARDGGYYRILSAEHVFQDYQFSTEGRIALPTEPRMRGCDAVRAIVPRCEAQGLRYSSDEIPHSTVRCRSQWSTTRSSTCS